MADPVAKIKIPNGAFRLDLNTGNHFADAAALRGEARHTTGDYAQVYGNQKFYRYNSLAGAVGDDDGDTVIRPGDVANLVNTGRWLETTTIALTAVDSTPSIGTESIVSYAWYLVSNPALLSLQPGDPGEVPIVTLVGSGVDINLNIDTAAAWQAGGLLVFLQVTDSLGKTSLGNPYDPTLNQDSLFTLILATENYGFRVPAAGSRNWQTIQNVNMRRIDEAMKDLEATVLATNAPTLNDKGMNPLGATLGDDAVVSGVTITEAPASDSYVRVFVNGISYELGDGDTNKACYFVDPGLGAPAGVRDIADITAGDFFVWNGDIVGFDLDTQDLIEFDYVRDI